MAVYAVCELERAQVVIATVRDTAAGWMSPRSCVVLSDLLVVRRNRPPRRWPKRRGGGGIHATRSNSMSGTDRGQVSRRAALKVAAGLAAGSAAFGQTARIGWAHDLRPADPAYSFDEYERIVDRDVTVRMLYEWPTLTNPIIFNNISNGLNGFQFSYDLPPNQIQVVVQAYATANLAMYHDTLWAKFRLGEIFKVQDPTTGEPAVRNIWFASKNPPMTEPPANRSNAYYSDLSLEGLQRRGVLFLI
jgi:hypothetical protein